MSDFETSNPYAPIAAASMDGFHATMLDRHYGGIGRLAYVGCTFLAGIIYNVVAVVVAMAIDNGPLSSAVFLITVMVYLGVLLFVIALRLKNMGYSRWWCVAAVVPLLNILVGLRCLMCPKGYADHKKLDTAGKIVAGLFVGALILLVCMFVLALFLGQSA